MNGSSNSSTRPATPYGALMEQLEQLHACQLLDDAAVQLLRQAADERLFDDPGLALTMVEVDGLMDALRVRGTMSVDRLNLLREGLERVQSPAQSAS